MLDKPVAARVSLGVAMLAVASSLAPAAVTSQDRSSPALFGLTPGPYAVGHAVRHEYDYSRTFKKPYDYFGERTPGEIARPIQITIWYPAGKDDGTPMR